MGIDLDKLPEGHPLRKAIDKQLQKDNIAKFKKKAKKHKYNAQRTEYNGIKYRSKKEADYARSLDLQMKRKDELRVVKWERELKYEIIVNQQLCGKYYLDFKIEYANGTTKYVDVKGYREGVAYRLYLLKKKLVEAIYHIIVDEY